MNIEVKGIRVPGNIAEERIVLKVINDDDIGRYAIFDTTYSEGESVSNKVRFTYWFPDKEVKSGDLIVLYSKKGVTTTTKRDDGSSIHFFYRGLDRTVWNKSGDCAVLIEVSNWSVTRAPVLETLAS